MIYSLRLLLYIVLAVAAQGQSSQSAPADTSIKADAPFAYVPMTGPMRLKWFVKSSIGRESLAAGVFSAAIGTATNSPREYGPHWDGLAKRYGMRFTGIATSNAMEAGLGSLWGEDPRYFRKPYSPFKARVLNAVQTTFTARHEDGSFQPAYARFIAISGSNFLSNTWRADREATSGHATLRIFYGVLGRMGSNAFAEFWPDVRKLMHRKNAD
jgi:hypothetical protein